MTAIALNGATGRMGRTIVSLLVDDPRFQLKRALTHQESRELGRDIGLLAGIAELGIPVTTASHDLLRDIDVVIDFSIPDAITACLDYCTAQNLGLVTGTTGFQDEQMKLIHQAAKEIPILVAPNMSMGVNVAFNLIAQATNMLEPDVDIEIYETHHRNKLDAPSGTAKRMGEIIEVVREPSRNDFSNTKNAKTANQKPIEFHSTRGGDVVGEHTVTFFGKGERLEITHRASSRTNFAAGALQGAAFVAQKREHGVVGMFGMNEVLGLS